MSANIPKPAAHITSQTPLLPAVQAWELYLQDQDRSPYTIKAFMGDLTLLAEFLPPDRTLGAITTGDLNNFLKWLQEGRGVPCSPKTLARRITSLKSFFRWLSEGGTILTDPAEKVVQQSVISPLPLILTPDEEAKVIETALAYREDNKPDVRPYALISLLLSTGIKKGECLAININHLELDGPQPYLFVRYANPNYRYKERKIDLPQEWIATYQEYLAQYQPGGQIFPWSPRRLEYLLEEIGEKAGLDKHLSFDMCRWTAALNDWRSGMDQEKIRQKLGISKVQWREVSMKLRKLAAQIDGGEV
jgi:integrase/recombinase XerD